MQINQLAALTGVSPKTIRYYEEIRLIPQPARGENNYRQYDEQAVERLRLVAGARRLDLSLDEIREIVALRDRHEAPCRVLLERLEHKADDIAERIRNLQQMEHELRDLHALGLTFPTDDVDGKHCVCHLVSEQAKGLEKMWAVFAIGAAVLTSFNPILYKRLLKHADAIVVVWGINLLALPLLGLFALALTPQFPRIDWLFVLGVLGSAGLNAVAHLASTRALKLADVSLVTPLLIFSPVFTVMISAVFLGEIPTTQGWFGVGLVVSGAYWLNRGPSAGWFVPFKSLALEPTIALVLLAGLLWAITPLFEKTAILHTKPASPRLAAFAVSALLVIILTPTVIARGRASVGKLFLHRRAFFLAALIAGVAPVLGYTAFSLGFVGYVTTLFKLSTLMTMIWSFLFLNEHGLERRLPASTVMVAGAILLAL